MLRILLDITEVLLGFVAAVFVLVTILLIIGQFVRVYRERRGETVFGRRKIRS